jgi:hypothetical protein
MASETGVATSQIIGLENLAEIRRSILEGFETGAFKNGKHAILSYASLD